jgi:hypothetical protein
MPPQKPKDPPAPKPDYIAEQVVALADRVSELEEQLASFKAAVAGHLGVSV